VLQTVLLVILIFVCVSLVFVILLQRSEGGALGMGGGPSGFMSTRGVGDLLTRATAILAFAFFALCLTLTLLIGRSHKNEAVVDRVQVQGLDPAALARQNALRAQQAQQPANNTTAPAGPAPGAPLFEAPKPEVHPAPANTAAPK
jgi:preprotein translocase subunit SecG